MRNVPEGSTVTRPGGLALIYVARGRFFDSQSKAESSNTKKIQKWPMSTLCTASYHHTVDICRISVCT